MSDAPPLNLGWKLPPIEKVHEALSAAIDGRVELTGSGSALVTSSDRSKKYNVTWDSTGTSFGSNDNASFFQGYIGYPIIAVLLALGRLPLDARFDDVFRDVPWKALNKAHKNKYNLAVDALLAERVTDPAHRSAIDGYVADLFTRLQALKLGRLRPTGRPPG